MSFLKPNYTQEQRDALERGAKRGAQFMPGGMTRALAKKVAPKALKIIKGYASKKGNVINADNGWNTPFGMK